NWSPVLWGLLTGEGLGSPQPLGEGWSYADEGLCSRFGTVCGEPAGHHGGSSSDPQVFATAGREYGRGPEGNPAELQRGGDRQILKRRAEGPGGQEDRHRKARDGPERPEATHRAVAGPIAHGYLHRDVERSVGRYAPGKRHLLLQG